MNSPSEPRYELKWILHCAIEGFERLVGLLSAQQVHEAIQAQFELAGRAIVLQGGEVAMNSGLGVCGLFDSAGGALDAARTICSAQAKMGNVGNSPGTPSLSVSVILAKGKILRGQIRGQDILQGPALVEIRDATAMTNSYGLDILATEGFYNSIKDPDGFWRIDQLGTEDGRKSGLFEYYAHQNAEARLFKKRWDLVFQQALADYFALNIGAAAEGFKTLNQEAPRSLPGRGVLELYLARCEDSLQGTAKTDFNRHLHCSGILSSRNSR
jgi:hypothetical protein